MNNTDLIKKAETLLSENLERAKVGRIADLMRERDSIETSHERNWARVTKEIERVSSIVRESDLWSMGDGCNSKVATCGTC